MNTEGAEVWMCRIVERYSDMLLRLAYSRLQSAAQNIRLDENSTKARGNPRAFAVSPAYRSTRVKRRTLTSHARYVPAA